jgi:hypothetical protein
MMLAADLHQQSTLAQQQEAVDHMENIDESAEASLVSTEEKRISLLDIVRSNLRKRGKVG